MWDLMEYCFDNHNIFLNIHCVENILFNCDIDIIEFFQRNYRSTHRLKILVVIIRKKMKFILNYIHYFD